MTTQSSKHPLATAKVLGDGNATNAPGITRGRPAYGTHLVGELTASYADLVAVLGEPLPESDGYKVSSEWELTFDGLPFTVYDYKATSLYNDDLPSVEEFRAEPSYDWHIGGLDRGETTQRFIAALRDAIKAVQQ